MRIVKNAFVTIVAMLLIISLSKNILSYKDKLTFYEEFRKDYEKEVEVNRKLKSELKRSSDSYYVERKIRNQLQLLKPGEVAVILPEITLSPTPTPTPVRKPYEEWRDLLLRKSTY